MQRQQPVFEELMTVSPPSIQETASIFECQQHKLDFECSNCSESIDEFLQDYRIQVIDIRNFMVYPGDCQSDPAETFEMIDTFDWMAFKSSSAFGVSNLGNNAQCRINPSA